MPARPPLRMLALAALVVLLVAPGCSRTPSSPTGAPGATSTHSGELRIFAAASLTAAFDRLAAVFEQQHPAVDVLPISYDGSQTLATQLVEGAPADVFASADETTMAMVVEAGLIEEPRTFASNTLVIAVPEANPGGVRSLVDLAADGLVVVLCAREVPCGAASAQVLAASDVVVTPASVEQNVTAVLAKVAAGEADAGLVYATDVLGRDDVVGLAAAGSEAAVNRYPIAALATSANRPAADAFVALVLSDVGRDVLTELGFGAP